MKNCSPGNHKLNVYGSCPCLSGKGVSGKGKKCMCGSGFWKDFKRGFSIPFRELDKSRDFLGDRSVNDLGMLTPLAPAFIAYKGINKLTGGRRKGMKF